MGIESMDDRYISNAKRMAVSRDTMDFEIQVSQYYHDNRSNLGFSHDLAPRPDPDDENEFFAYGLLVVGVRYAGVRV